MDDRIFEFVDETVRDVPDENKKQAYCLVASLVGMIHYIELASGDKVGFQGVNQYQLWSAFKAIGISKNVVRDRLRVLVELGVLSMRVDDDGRKWYTMNEI